MCLTTPSQIYSTAEHSTKNLSLNFFSFSGKVPHIPSDQPWQLQSTAWNSNSIFHCREPDEEELSLTSSFEFLYTLCDMCSTNAEQFWKNTDNNMTNSKVQKRRFKNCTLKWLLIMLHGGHANKGSETWPCVKQKNNYKRGNLSTRIAVCKETIHLQIHTFMHITGSFSAHHCWRVYCKSVFKRKQKLRLSSWYTEQMFHTWAHQRWWQAWHLLKIGEAKHRN